jgi:hypothetical protein
VSSHRRVQPRQSHHEHQNHYRRQRAFTPFDRNLLRRRPTLGAPVVPDVYMMTAVSSAVGGMGATGVRAPWAATSDSFACAMPPGGRVGTPFLGGVRSLL